LIAEAKEVSRNAKLATYTILVTDEMQETVAIFQGMVYIKSSKK
jgi:acyl-CoA thioesterase